jgi:hypothetical protein
MLRENLIRIEVPSHLREGIHSKRALLLLHEARKRNVRNVDHIDHITVRDTRNPDGSVNLFTVVVAKPLPDGCHGKMVWGSPLESRRHRYFFD